MTKNSDKSADDQSEARISVAYNKNCHLLLMTSLVKHPPGNLTLNGTTQSDQWPPWSWPHPSSSPPWWCNLDCTALQGCYRAPTLQTGDQLSWSRTHRETHTPGVIVSTKKKIGFLFSPQPRPPWVKKKKRIRGEKMASNNIPPFRVRKLGKK